MADNGKAVAWFGEVGIADRPTVGGKGGSLGELAGAGIAVPPGFVVTTHAFEQFLMAIEKRAPVRAKVEALNASDLGAATKLSEELRRRVVEEPLPADVEQAILAAHGELGAGAVAVRSSATTEDAEDASFAGLQDTFLWVLSGAETVARVRECWGSLYSVESMTYRLKHDLPEEGVAMAVVVQQMVDARTAGVMFTRSPTTGDKSVITIEGAWGLGSSVVSGEVTPDRWVMGKITGEISTRDISHKHAKQVQAEGGGIVEIELDAADADAACLSDDELQALRVVGRTIERHYGRPQDIEWAFDQAGQLLLLQSRPETVWSVKEAKPIAETPSNPLNHVMNIFGGAAMILTAKDIAEITRLLDESHFSELKLEIGEFKLRVSRGGSGRRFVEDEDDAPAPSPKAGAAPAPIAPSGDPDVGEVDILAPLLGNFYHSPRPGDPPFIAVGDKITEDSAIGIIEVMKLMNSVRAGVAGTVVAILAEDGNAVEAGQPLIRVNVG